MKPVNCCVVRQKGRWLSLPSPAGTTLPAAWGQGLWSWKDGDVLGWGEAPRLGGGMGSMGGAGRGMGWAGREGGREAWMDGERREDQTGAGSGASPGKSLYSRQPGFEAQEGSAFYFILKMKRPMSRACFILLFGLGWPSGGPALGCIQRPGFDVCLHEDLLQSSQLNKWRSLRKTRQLFRLEDHHIPPLSLATPACGCFCPVARQEPWPCFSSP